jgi:hypothetical protein
MLLAMGWSNDRIAGCVRDPRTGKPISTPTLKRHFRAELQVRDQARDQLTARRLMQTWSQAEGGNVGAQRLMRDLIRENDLMGAEAALARETQPAKPAPKGKKEQTHETALAADQALEAELSKEANGRPN